MRTMDVAKGQQFALLGALLQKARRGTGISQLELALRLGVSQRHVSFVERGQSRPGPALLAAWLAELDTPPAARNAIMLHAGYTPVPALGGTSTEQMELHKNALLRVVEARNPMPAFIFDADWRMCALNEGGQRLCELLMPEYWTTVRERDKGFDMIDALTNPQGPLSRMDNAAEVAVALLRQLRMEEWANPALQERVDAYEESVHRRFGKQADLGMASNAPTSSLELHFTTPHGPLSFHTLENVVDLPQNVNLRTYRLELWFPADEKTHQAIMHPECALTTACGAA